MDVRKYVLDLNNVVRIDVEPLKSDLVRLLITKVNWINEGDVSVFAPDINVDMLKIYGSRDQLIRFIVKLVKILGRDAKEEVLERLSSIEDDEDKYMDVVFPYTPHIVKIDLNDGLNE